MDDMTWIMPLLRQTVPKWKEILMNVGITNDHILSIRDQAKDEVGVLNMGIGKWLGQESPGVTLVNLAAALSSPEVGEEALASEIVKGKFHR